MGVTPTGLLPYRWDLPDLGRPDRDDGDLRQPIAPTDPAPRGPDLSGGWLPNRWYLFAGSTTISPPAPSDRRLLIIDLENPDVRDR